MKKLISLAVTLMAATVIPSSAMAIDTTDCYVVVIESARGPVDAGEWIIDFDWDSGLTCDYAVEWTSPYWGVISTDCVLQELKVHGRRSCIFNSLRNFPTIVDLDPTCECLAFSEFGLLEVVDFISLNESRLGLHGVIKMSGPGWAVRGMEVLRV